jgi:hypothetical protein
MALLSCLLMMVLSCRDDVRGDLGPEVVKVYEHVLYTSDLESKMPEGYAKADSARIASQIVNNWIREKVLLNMAEQNLSEAQKNVDKQLEEYRNSLVVYAYERALIGQKLDTIVSDEELAAYYNDNIETFKLKSYIAKMRFVKVASEAPMQNKLQKWFLSNEEADYEELYDYCRKYADNFFLEEDKWLYLEDIMKEVPLPAEDLSSFLKSGSDHTFESNNFTYYVRFFDYRLKDDTAPLALERSKIKNLILNKRKATLIVQMRDDVVNEAHANGKIQLFE